MSILAVIIVGALAAACEADRSPSAPSGTAIDRSAPTVISIAIEQDRGTPIVDRTVQYTATAMLSDGSRQDVTASAEWKSSNPAVATVESGLVRLIKTGELMLTAAYRGALGQVHVGVTIFEDPAPDR